MAWPSAGPSRQYNLHQDLPPAPPAVPMKMPSPMHSPNPDQGWNTINGNGHAQNYDNGSEERGEGSKRNPLVDLMDSERLYVEQLALVIRRVAAAWSRKDFPPPKLDSMFRCVEAVYRANRAFGNKLKEIGPNPSSPKALGDLLMRWIDDLEAPYAKYATSFLTGFDSWSAVTRNTILPGILQDITISTPPTPPLQQWSLDALFLLPYTRLRYYRKLYARLLRSTKEGRSDHRLLVVANQRLEGLVNQTESRLEVDVTDEDQDSPEGGHRSSQEQSNYEKERQSRTSSGMNSSQDSDTNSPFSSRVGDSRLSAGSAATSVTTQSPQRRPHIVVPSMTPANQPLSSSPAIVGDLEMRINTERALDLFTMNPKKCKLQMNPPQLPFQRNLRSSHDVTIYFTPNSTGHQVVHQRAHVFILTDLFLVAEWMEAADKASKAQQVAREQPERVGQGGPMPEMWLSYPPLAGKHLMVAEGPQSNVVNIMIMRKETFSIHAENEMARDQLMKDLLDCIEFAATVTRNGNAPLPSPVGDARSPSSLSDTRSGENGMPNLRYPSPFSASSSPSVSPRISDPQEGIPPPIHHPSGNLVAQMNSLNLHPGQTVNGIQPGQMMNGIQPGQTMNSLQPGQTMNSLQPGQTMNSLQPGQMMASEWSRNPSPDVINGMAVPPLPTGSATGILPPRGASLRTRVPSGPPAPPPHPTLSHYSDPMMATQGSQMPRSPSGRSVSSGPRPNDMMIPPIPIIRGPGSHMSDSSGGSLHNPPSRSRSAEPLRPLEPPSARFSSFPNINTDLPRDEHDSPPASPEEEEVAALTGPAVISAQMKCKVFLKQAHQQWKSLGAAKLKLYVQQGKNTKQLVVESDSSSKAMLISTIVLTDGVERVAKTGVAVEISDRGKRTGIIYMIQLRNENSAMGLFESLLAGSDRVVR